MALINQTLTLACEELKLVIAPHLGGSIVSCTLGAHPVLHAIPPARPRAGGAYPLIPFSGRIASAMFPFDGRNVHLEPNFPPEPHAIHGQAWLASWTILEHDQTNATLGFEHDGRDWPWSYGARQRIGVSPGGFELTLSVVNRSPEAMPAGLGWHPFFPKADAELRADVQRIWLNDDSMIPADAVDLGHDSNVNEFRAARELNLDNVFGGATNGVELRWPTNGLRVTLTAGPPMDYLVIYTPPSHDFFCVEPVSHVPNAHNARRPSELGLRVLEAGAELTAKISVGIASDDVSAHAV